MNISICILKYVFFVLNLTKKQFFFINHQGVKKKIEKRKKIEKEKKIEKDKKEKREKNKSMIE